MEQREVLRNQLKNENHDTREVSVIGKTLFVAGVCIMFISIIYMLVHLSIADDIIEKWLFFMVTGIGVIVAGLVVDIIHSIRKDH